MKKIAEKLADQDGEVVLVSTTIPMIEYNIKWLMGSNHDSYS